MGRYLVNGKKVLQTFLYIAILILIAQGDVGAQIGLQIPHPPKTVDLIEPEAQGLALLLIDSTQFKVKPPHFKRIVKLDSAGTFISAMESVDQTEFYFPSVVDLDTYIRLRLQFDRKEIWKKSIVQVREKREEGSGGAIQLDIPVRIKSETFTRIFGSDRVSLRVSGNISFDLSGRSEKRSGTAVSRLQQGGNFSPRFNQTQQFTIEGKIGEKVTVSVEQNSEATFDFENTLKLKYDGGEDEIIQTIEAGNIGLSLPSTKYVIFGGSNKGLFGIKTEMRVGDFFMTAIASLEKGEQKKLTISGSSSESENVVHDYDFIKNRYFFVDTYYKDYYEEGFSEDLQQWYYQNEDRLIREFDVYKTESYANQNAREGIAVLNPEDYKGIESLEGIETVPGEVEKATFAPLERGTDYDYDYAQGVFWLRQEVRDNEVLAIAYQTGEGANAKKVGTLFSDVVGADSTKPYVLRLIKPQSMQPAYTNVWPLMMRNVYFLGGTNIEEEGFDLNIEFNLGGEHETRQDVAPRKSYNYLLGIDRVDENGSQLTEGDKKVDKNPFLINRAEGILIFPSLQPFDPLPGSRFENDPNNAEKEGLADTNRVRIYNISDQTERVQRTKFEIVVTSKSTKSTFDLGFNVLEGSEEVLLNGSPLKRNEDYLIDYFTGQITLISSRAKRASSNIEIKYEKATIFQLDKKTILGGRAEYRFWEDSFIGFTALYLNKSTLDQRVRVGQEPFRNFVWDINTALKFKPKFLTQLVDALPLIKTNEPSSFNVEAEFAQVMPNPNTMDNENTGDINGVAYIDDFEGTKRTTTLGIRYRTWTNASPPTLLPKIRETSMIDTIADRARGRMVWFNPFNQVLIKDIWPNRDVNAETGQTTDVLGIQAWHEEGRDPDSAWVGVMRSTASFANQQRTKYIEMWVKEDTIRNPERVRINVDIGQISEDWYMHTVKNGKRVYGGPDWRGLNTEDKNRNGVLDGNEDTGIDGISFGQPGYDPYDKWREPDRASGNYEGINGTEGNSQAQGANYPDTEDLDGNGQVNLINEYFEYSFTLDPKDEKSKAWLSGSTEKGWRQFRIPLKDYIRKVGNPDTTFQSIYFVRLWFSNLSTQKKELYIATFDFVGNEWEEEGIAASDTSNFVKNDSLFSITVYNTEENAVAISGGPEPYHSPPGVSGVRDRITRAMSKEQSMVFRMVDLKPDALVEARKTLYGEIVSLVNYKKIRMFVHGDQYLPYDPSVDSSHVRVYIRFGADTKNYYEYGQSVYAHWSKLNEIDIDLEDLSRTKFVGDQEAIIKIKPVPEKPDGYYKVVGNPSLNTIRYFRIGVKNRDPVRSFTGEIWFDELRISEVRQESGTALRLSTSLKLADLLNFNANFESKDADFHDIKTQFGTGNTVEAQNYSGVFYFDRFLPDQWNISIPIDARASFHKDIPKYFPRTDIYTNYNNNSIEKKLKSLFGLRELDPELESQVSYSEIYGIGTTIKKRSRSKAWYFYYTIDQIAFDFDYSKKNSRNYQTEFNKSLQWRGSISYDIPFGKDNYIEPFQMLKIIPVLNMISDQKLYYTPSNMNMSLNIADTDQKSKLRSESETTRQQNVNSTRKLNMSYRLIPSINFTYGRTHQTDADYVGMNGKELIKSIIKKLDFGKETDINQAFKMDYKPNIFKWLTADYSYSANFRYYFTNLAKNQKQSTNRVQQRINFSLSPSTIADFFYTPKSDKKAPTSRNKRPVRRQKKQDEEQEEAEEEEQQEEGQKDKGTAIKIPNPLLLIYGFFNAWQKIQTSYTWDQNVTNSYVSSIPTWKYQFGLTQDPGVPQDTTITNSSFIGPSTTDSRTLSTSLNFDISRNIRTSFNHQYNVSNTSNDKTKSGNESITFLALGDNPQEKFKGIGKDIRSLIPDWSVKISGLEKILFFQDFAKTVSLDHSRSGKYSTTKKLAGNALVPANESFSNNYGPFIGINISWLFGMSSTLRINKSTNYNFNSGGGSTKSETSSLSISASYATQGGFKIPIPIWPFKGATFKNEINFSLAYDMSDNITYQKQFNQTDFQETQKNTSWKLRPSATYRFNTRVSGSLFYETGVTENKISGKFSWNEFGITVNIAIRD